MNSDAPKRNPSHSPFSGASGWAISNSQAKDVDSTARNQASHDGTRSRLTRRSRTSPIEKRHIVNEAVYSELMAVPMAIQRFVGGNSVGLRFVGDDAGQR